MIGFLRGLLHSVNDEVALVDVNGVGYELSCSLNTATTLTAQIGSRVELWVHTHVREDALTLFAFLSDSEKKLFLNLIKVNGIGPKSALAVLSGGSTEQISNMIENGDVAALSKLPKVGKKTAEQLVLTLKGKLPTLEMKAQSRSQDHQQIAFALMNLGFKPASVDDFLGKLPQDIEVEEGVRRGLKDLSRF